MSQPLYSEVPNDECPVRGRTPVAWMDGLPPDLIGMVVEPVRFDIASDFELAADRSLGLDAEGQACFCAFRYVRTALRSDDDEIYYQAPVYAETVTAWRLKDSRWLASHTTIGNFDAGAARTWLSISQDMPR